MQATLSFALDNITEKEVQKSINKLMKNRTSLIIAHRLSTIEDADIIYILDQGKIAGKGSDKELLKNNSIYSELYSKGKLTE